MYETWLKDANLRHVRDLHLMVHTPGTAVKSKCTIKASAKGGRVRVGKGCCNLDYATWL